MTSTKKNIFQAVYIIRSNILIIFIEVEIRASDLNMKMSMLNRKTRGR